MTKNIIDRYKLIHRQIEIYNTEKDIENKMIHEFLKL